MARMMGRIEITGLDELQGLAERLEATAESLRSKSLTRQARDLCAAYRTLARAKGDGAAERMDDSGILEDLRVALREEARRVDLGDDEPVRDGVRETIARLSERQP